ncbi:MAG: rhodanese-like domain-containing protein [Bacteroidota bacterium]
MISCLSQLACSQSKLELAVNAALDFSVDTIDVEILKEYIADDQSLIILDTRSEKEFNMSHIEGARFIDYDNFSKQSLSDVDPDSRIVTYCSIGYRSEKIAEKLEELGFSNVNNLYGGIFEWKNSGNPVVNQEGNETDTVHTYNRIWSFFLTNGIRTYD